MVKNENLAVWPLSNWELVSHFFIFRFISDAICHTLFYEREMILLRYAEVYSNQFTTGDSPFQLVQSSTVLNSKKTWYKPDEDWYWPVEISQLNSISSCLISPCKRLLDCNVLIYFDWSRSFRIRRWAGLIVHGFCSGFFTLTKHFKKLWICKSTCDTLS